MDAIRVQMEVMEVAKGVNEAVKWQSEIELAEEPQELIAVRNQVRGGKTALDVQ
jgi:hypothetical protein